jgi:hypothetical protein
MVINKGEREMPNPHGGSEVVSVTPNPVPLGTGYTVDGSGFDPNTRFAVFIIANPGGTEFVNVVSDADGKFSSSQWGSSATSLSIEVKTEGQGAAKVLATCTATIA